RAFHEQGDIDTTIGNLSTASYSPLSLAGVSDVVVEPGFIGLGDSSREVVFRFAEPLPDDLYQIDILGTGVNALRNVDGELFQDGNDLTRLFEINLGPQVAAVVPEPIRRNPTTGALSPDTGVIEVHFNDDDLDPTSAETADFYQLIFTGDTVRNTDDFIVTPTSVTYNNITNIATLDFSRPLSRIPDPRQPGSFLQGAARLRVGSSEGLPAPPTEVSLLLDPNNPVEPGDSFDTAFDLNSQWTIGTNATQSARLNSEIFNTVPFELELPGPDLPGTRDIRPDDPSRLTRTVPLDFLRNGADTVDGISVIQYDFAPSWIGDDPNRPGILEDTTYFNVISEQQKERVREALQLFSEYLGISFVEVEGAPTSDAFISIAVGDLYGGDERAVSGEGGLAVVTRDRDGDGIDDLGVLDFQDFDESVDDQFGGEFFRGAMFVVGQLLGYGFADDLPQPVTQSTDFIFTPGTDNEPAFPSVADIVHGQYLFRPDSTDIDLYRFTLETRGKLSIETIAERLGDPSLLDTALRLYQLAPDGSFNEIASNDDYFSNDSLIDVEVPAGTYVVGVSARGNTTYDPNIEASGFGGLSEGEYELRLDFRPSATTAIVDTSGVALDGDGDNRPGGFFDFWFVPNDPNNTLYVDKAAGPFVGGQIQDLVPDSQVLAPQNSLFGQIGNPYNEIDDALARAAAQPGFTTIRIVGNGGVDGRVETPEDNFSYQIGFANNGLPLSDGSSMDLPQGVRVVIDSGAVLKFSGSRIGVGSVSPLVDVSDSSLQILGLPSIISDNGLPARDETNAVIPGSVYLTSFNDDTLGAGNSPLFTPPADAGDWGGIDFRGDLDTADESRRNRELEGVFLNHVQHADIRFGGGSVSIGGRQVQVSPIDMAITRPTIINSSITKSADAAIAATPDTFEETRFTETRFQDLGAFTPDYTRVGPEIFGNFISDNSFNGLFIRVATRTGATLETISTSARFDDTDITHILPENLVIEGTAGGPILRSSAPSSLLVRLLPTPAGDVPAGTYVYRITNVDSAGLETAASQPTVPITLNSTGGVQLNQLPTVEFGSDFVSRRLYRATVDPATNLPGQFTLVSQLNASDTSFVDRVASGSSVLSEEDVVLRARLDARLAVDPVTIVKVNGARIEARFGANLLAEGAPGLPVVFTSLDDQRYGTGGTFDTNGRGQSGQLDPGDWGGIYVGQGSSASIDNAVIAGAGGTTRIEGGFASFNPIEVQQGRLRLANTRFDQNADGRGDVAGTRVGRGDNASGTLFVRAAHPVIVNNEFVGGAGPALTFDINSLSAQEVVDGGRSTGMLDSIDVIGNAGPLIQNNVLDSNEINGLQVRGGQLATAGVWDDVDIVHVVTESIEVPNKHIFGGLRLQSDARGSLVVKFESEENETAGIVVGGSLATAADELRDISDRIGGSLQLVGHPDFPVVLTTLADDFAGAGFDLDGLAQVDTNNDGVIGGALSDQRLTVGSGAGPNFVVLPTGPEVNLGTTIDNDVNPNTPGFFEATPTDGNEITFASSGVTVQDLSNGQLLIDQDFIFSYNTFIETNNTVIALSGTTITQPATLIADDVVESRGTFAGANGTVNWIATSSFIDGVATLFTSLQLFADSSQTLGDIRVHSYLDEDIDLPSDDILVTTGTPGAADFRALTLDGGRRVGFSHGGFYLPDGINLSNATYAGWTADQFNDLQTDILAGNAAYTVPGNIDLAALPAQADPDFGTSFGPNDVTTAFAWDTDANATSAVITSFLELVPTDPSISVTGADAIQPGLWNGVVIREAADDRNVAAIAEQEPVRTSVFNTNSIPSQSQFLGELAPNEASGDENRRLGFIIDGAITTRDDLDVYSFIAESGTEVFLDIDRTGNQLDSVVELIDVNGIVLASSNDSLLAETNASAIFTNSNVNPDAARPLAVVPERLESQRITISESIVDATGGELTLSIAGAVAAVTIPVDVFLADPAGAIESALESQYPDELGDITANLMRRSDREVDPSDPGVITRAGDNFVIELRFDEGRFVGSSAPLVSVDTTGVLGAVVNASVSEVLLGSQLQDNYSSNPKDAGLRIRLPGEAGTRNLYHIRVRSSNTRDPLDFATLNDPNRIQDGLSMGRYELQVRLREQDESPGTQVRLADIRYATNGLQIIGQPFHSPLLGEEHETSAANDSLADAQPLGILGVSDDLSLTEAGPLQSDRLSKSFAGTIDSATDVDWYRFNVNYDNLTRDGANLYLSTVFDLDYSSNFARADMALYVFDANGQLILVGGDSNIADDQPGTASSNDTGDLSRGSAGSEDPYIGATELSEGTYFVAVANQQQVPLPLDQFFNPNSANPLLRLEPVDSVRRIVEDRIGSFGGGTASDPVTPILFDQNSIVEHSFDDTLLFVNTVNSLLLVNPFTGETYGTIGNFGDEIRDVAFRANGELFAYSGFDNRPIGDQAYFYYRIDTSDASLSAPLSTGAGMTTHHDLIGDTVLEVVSDDGLQIEAISIREFQNQEVGFFIGNRPIDRTGPTTGNL
ncbi:MAG: cyclic nucleotide-binding protein, partial [Pirellulales bacterium]|nr:cyclic nucleotide-binding protein [Pirellulales bacterium]